MSLVERLVQQRLKSRMRDVEIEMETKSLEQKQRREKELQETLAATAEKLKVANEQLAEARKERAEVDKEFDEVKQQDEVARNRLMAELKVEIDKINELGTAAAQRLPQLRADNTGLQRQLEIYTSHQFKGRDKYEELAATRNEQMERAKEKQERDAARVPVLKAQVEKEAAALQALRESHAEVQAKLDEYVKKFDGVRAQLDTAKSAYDEARAEKAKQEKVVQRLEGEISTLVARVRISSKERNKEFEQHHTWQQKVTSVQRQIDALTKLLDELQNGGGADPTVKGDAEGQSSAAKETSTEAELKPADEQKKEENSMPAPSSEPEHGQSGPCPAEENSEED